MHGKIHHTIGKIEKHNTALALPHKHGLLQPMMLAVLAYAALAVKALVSVGGIVITPAAVQTHGTTICHTEQFGNSTNMLLPQKILDLLYKSWAVNFN